MPFGTKVGFGPGHIVLDGEPASSPPQKRHSSPRRHFSAHVYCGQTAAWIKMALGMEVGLGPGIVVLDGYSAPLPGRGTAAPNFSADVYCGQTSGWIRIRLGTMEVGLGPGDVVLGVHPVHPLNGTWQPPTFRSTFLWHGRPSQLLPLHFA